MNRTSSFEFTIIVPMYNEADNLPELERRLSAYTDRCRYRACVLFVDDGSTDGSLAGLRKICSAHESFFYISFSGNRGLSAALKAGFDYADSRYVGYIDADLQTDPDDFDLLLPYLQDFGMATGIRVKRNDSAFKRFQSRFANSFRRMMTGDGATDTGCPLKVFRRSVAKAFPMFKGMHRFFPALVLLQENGCYKEVPVRHYPRTAGVSKFNIWNRMTSSLADCFAYRWMKSRYIRYTISSSDVELPACDTAASSGSPSSGKFASDL